MKLLGKKTSSLPRFFCQTNKEKHLGRSYSFESAVSCPFQDIFFKQKKNQPGCSSSFQSALSCPFQDNFFSNKKVSQFVLTHSNQLFTLCTLINPSHFKNIWRKISIRIREAGNIFQLRFKHSYDTFCWVKSTHFSCKYLLKSFSQKKCEQCLDNKNF